jgi:hypothetical protein
MDGKNASNQERLSSLLASLSYPSHPQPQIPIRIQTKRGRRSEQFAGISKMNAAIVDDLINVAEKLANEGKGTEAASLIKIIRKLLENNHRLQQVVNEALLDIPN